MTDAGTPDQFDDESTDSPEAADPAEETHDNPDVDDE